MYNFPMMNQPMYPQFNNIPTMQNYNQPQFKINQVSNIDEAKSCLIDPLSTHLFIDYNSGKIYMKRMNNNGLSDFYIFAIENSEKQNDPMIEINQRLINIENKLGGIKNESVTNDESNDVSTTTNNAENATKQSATISKSKSNA